MNSVIYVYSSRNASAKMLKAHPDLKTGFPYKDLEDVFRGKKSALMHYRSILHGVNVSECSLVEIEPITLYDATERHQYRYKVASAANYSNFGTKPTEDAWERLKDYAAKDVAVQKTWLDAIDDDFEHSWIGVAIFVLAGLGLLITLWLSI